MIRYRARQRERAELQHVIEAHERAGDVAREHHLYDDAARRYEMALKVSAMTAEQRLRVSEKFATTAFLGRNPSVENPWVKEFVPERFQNSTERKLAFDLLYQHVRQMGAALRLDDEHSISVQALRIAEAIDAPHFLRIAYAKMASVLTRLGRLEDAKKYLRDVGDVGEDDALDLQIMYHILRAFIEATEGHAAEAYESCRRASHLVEEGPDLYLTTAVWENYGRCAALLGDADKAKICLERALSFARQNQIAWRIPYLCLGYADLLARSGRDEVAYGYLQEALSYDVQTPVLDVLLAEIGIPLALRMRDEATVTRCSHASVIRMVFRSQGPMSIGPVSAAFAQLYMQRGEKRKAQQILHRALGAVHHVDLTWDLPLEIARCGSPADLPEARKLLERRVALPTHAVAAAYLSLFDAFAACRHKQPESARRHAGAAVKKFEAIGWLKYAEIARALLPAAADPQPVGAIARSAVAKMQSALTPREKQVAELVMKGLTNREIATRLSITKHTVDSHVASIIERLGIRSRHQLADAVWSHP